MEYQWIHFPTKTSGRSHVATTSLQHGMMQPNLSWRITSTIIMTSIYNHLTELSKSTPTTEHKSSWHIREGYFKRKHHKKRQPQTNHNRAHHSHPTMSTYLTERISNFAGNTRDSTMHNLPPQLQHPLLPHQNLTVTDEPTKT